MNKSTRASRKGTYHRIRGDSGQLRRTGIAMLLLGAAAVSWFVIVQSIHKLPQAAFLPFVGCGYGKSYCAAAEYD